MNVPVGFRPSPADHAWSIRIDHLPVDPESDRYVASVGAGAPLHPDFGRVRTDAPWGIPYVVVPGSQRRVPVLFDYAEESDHELYPLPSDSPIKGGPRSRGDRHVIMLDRDHPQL